MEPAARSWELYIDSELWSLRTTLFGGESKTVVSGETRDLEPDGMEMKVGVIVNDVPQYVMMLTEGVNSHQFGRGLKKPEQEYIMGEVNSFLAQIL